MDLFIPVCEEERLHPHFKILMLDASKPVRETLLSWAEGFIDRDNKFIKEFQTTFNSSYWELYLHQCFKEYGIKTDYSIASPDFFLTLKNGKNINVEAVTTNNAMHDEPEWSSSEVLKEYLNKPRNEILEYASIRIFNSIDYKHKKYVQKYEKEEHVKGNPFVIAIAPFEQPAFSRQNNEAINQVLYGREAPKISGVSSTGSIDITSKILQHVKKPNGTILDLGVFTTDKYKEISAVIFSTTATYSKAIVQSKNIKHCMVNSRRYKCGDGWFGYIEQISEHRVYKESHLDGLHIYYNPFAVFPLDEDVFYSEEVTNNTYDVTSESMVSEHNDGALVSRSTYWGYDK